MQKVVLFRRKRRNDIYGIHINMNKIILNVGDKYNIKDLGEGTVISVLPNHYEIFFENIQKMKLISKNGNDLSIVNLGKNEHTFESDKNWYLSSEIKINDLPKRAKDCLDYAGIINHQQLLNLSDEKINEIIKIKPIEVQKHIINSIHKKQTKTKNFLKWLEKQYINPPKSQVYRIPKEDRQLFMDRENFQKEHPNDFDDYFEELYFDNNIKRLRYFNKDKLSYKLIHDIDDIKVKNHFFAMLKLETIDNCNKYQQSFDKTDYWNSYKAYCLLTYLVRDLDEKNIDIQEQLQKIVHKTIYAIRKNKEDYFINELNCSLTDFKRRFELLFKDGMNWDNYGKWHVDHIKPCSSYNLTNLNQKKECFNLLNFQPLWAQENIAKSNSDYYPAKYIVKEFIDISKNEDQLFVYLNNRFKKEHPPAFYDYISNENNEQSLEDIDNHDELDLPMWSILKK